MKNNKQRAELALLISLPETIKGITKPGRLRNLISKIAGEAEKIYDNEFKKATKSEQFYIGMSLDKFNRSAQWSKRPRHILSYLSAIAIFIEGRGYRKIESLIMEVTDYYERAGKVQPACYWSALDAEKLWNNSFNI